MIEQHDDGLNMATLSKNERLVVDACRKIATTAPDYYATKDNLEFVLFRDPFTEIPSGEYTTLKDGVVEFDVLEDGKSIGRQRELQQCDIVNHIPKHLSGRSLRVLSMIIGKVTKMHPFGVYKAECYERDIPCTIGFFDSNGDFMHETQPPEVNGEAPLTMTIEAPLTMTIDELRNWVSKGALTTGGASRMLADSVLATAGWAAKKKRMPK